MGQRHLKLRTAVAPVPSLRKVDHGIKINDVHPRDGTWSPGIHQCGSQIHRVTYMSFTLAEWRFSTSVDTVTTVCGQPKSLTLLAEWATYFRNVLPTEINLVPLEWSFQRIHYVGLLCMEGTLHFYVQSDSFTWNSHWSTQNNLENNNL